MLWYSLARTNRHLCLVCSAVGRDGVHSGTQRAIRSRAQGVHLHRAVGRRARSRGAHPAERLACRCAASASLVQASASSSCSSTSLITESLNHWADQLSVISDRSSRTIDFTYDLKSLRIFYPMNHRPKTMFCKVRNLTKRIRVFFGEIELGTNGLIFLFEH